jgi:hypothetical protein
MYMGLVKTRRLAAMQKQQRAKAGMKPRAKKGGALPPHLYKSGGQTAADLPRHTVLNVLQNIKTTEYTEYTEKQLHRPLLATSHIAISVGARRCGVSPRHYGGAGSSTSLGEDAAGSRVSRAADLLDTYCNSGGKRYDRQCR